MKKFQEFFFLRKCIKNIKLIKHPSNFTIYDTQDSVRLITSIIKEMNLDKDIYKCNRKEGGGWSDPEILGTEINTEFDEDGPFLSSDGNTFYFS